jgi:hypothetical protein
MNFKQYLLQENIKATLVSERLAPPVDQDGEGQIPEFIDTHTELATNYKGYDIYLSHYFKIGPSLCLFDNNKKCIAFITFNYTNKQLYGDRKTTITYKEEEYKQLTRMWVHEDYRGKGLNDILHLAGLYNLDLTILTDDEVSPDGYKYYQKFFTKYPNIKKIYYNEKMDKFFEEEPIGLWKVPNFWRILFSK